MRNEQTRDTDMSMYMYVEIKYKKQFDFLCVRSSLRHNVTSHSHMCCGTCTHGDTQQTETTQTTYSAQTPNRHHALQFQCDQSDKGVWT